MLTKSEQAVYRPLVEKAWLQHCRLMDLSPNNKPARDVWYRDQVHGAIGKWSTRDADPVSDYRRLVDRFMLLAGEPQLIIVKGWSQAQTEWFTKEAHRSYSVGKSTGFILSETDFETWVTTLLECHSIFNHYAVNNKETFDKVMADLATISGYDRMISHFSEATEIRVRWQLRRYMSDLEWLEKTPVSWDYVQAIWNQAELLPASMDDAPAATLIKVVQMLDTHIRRHCKIREIPPKCIPSRCHPDRCRTTHGCPDGFPSCESICPTSTPPDDIPF